MLDDLLEAARRVAIEHVADLARHHDRYGQPGLEEHAAQIRFATDLNVHDAVHRLFKPRKGIYAMTKPGNIYVEPRDEGGYSVKREGAKRASAVLPTQKEAIARARELEPGKQPNVARVRNVSGRGPDKFRKS